MYIYIIPLEVSLGVMPLDLVQKQLTQLYSALHLVLVTPTGNIYIYTANAWALPGPAMTTGDASSSSSELNPY
jgi:hypothetical protein